MTTWWVPAQLESAAIVRHDLATALRSDGVPEPVVDDVVLVASELVGNAVRHAQALPAGRLAITWDRRADGITLSVTDGGGWQLPRMRTAGHHDTRGRGMSIVAALTDSWGVTRGPGTVTVWAHVPERQPVPA